MRHSSGSRLKIIPARGRWAALETTSAERQPWRAGHVRHRRGFGACRGGKAQQRGADSERGGE